jgi:hypothetical protein
VLLCFGAQRDQDSRCPWYQTMVVSQRQDLVTDLPDLLWLQHLDELRNRMARGPDQDCLVKIPLLYGTATPV